MTKALFLADPISKLHDTGPGHPESAARWDAAVRGLEGNPVSQPPPREATLEELALCHTRPYIEQARRDVEFGYSGLSTGDTDICGRSFEVAARAAGTILHAVDEVMEGRALRAFCVVRPPGHHATTDHGMGFCLFNSVAIAARYAQKQFGIDRVLIVDWDVHHGNGTQDIFYEDGSVYFFSTHQHPWYPGTGAMDEKGSGKGDGTTMNCPLPAGAGRDEIFAAFNKLGCAMEDYRPDLILISAGFDSRTGDPLGHFRLEDRDFADLTRMMLELADRYGQGRVISTLEGGYDLNGLTSAVSSHAGALNSE